LAESFESLLVSNNSQICFIFKRVYVHESIYDEFRDQLVEATKHLKVGPGVDETTRIGPVQNRMQYEKLKDLLQHTKDHGGHFAIGGQTLSSGTGYFINPTIVDCPSDQSRIVVEEQFGESSHFVFFFILLQPTSALLLGSDASLGPIIPLLRWATEEEVIKRANETIYGLAASVWAVNLTLANRLARRLEGGIVWINTHFDPDPGVPVGGHKQSGIGVEFGVAGLKTYCNSQAIFLRKQ
jgi:acyl-CoA reductase-like NAD-dependent aldehyde dehydrogenase